jgi:V/A-type H+-transporting ATPase subunit D
MARKIKLTRPELKRQRDALARFQRYLPMLKLKQQQLQLTVRDVRRELRRLREAVEQAEGRFARYGTILRDVSGVNVRALAEVENVRTSEKNVAGVRVPVFEDASFPAADYSLFATPPWVDKALADLREISRHRAELDVVRRRRDLLVRELNRIIQRVNLFEKVKIPEARENIRRIRIHLGDEMTAAVGRAKIAKAKIVSAEGGPEAVQI